MNKKQGRIGWLIAMFALLSATQALAAQPCEVRAQIAPDNQMVSEAALVQLNGQPSKNAVSYLWEQISGPAVALVNSASDKPSFKAPEVGVTGALLVFRMTVTGCLDQSKSMTTSVNVVNVSEPNLPPTAVATADPNPVLEGEVVTLNGAASTDPNPGDILSYSWTQTGGKSVALIPDSSAAIVRFTAPNVGPDGESLSFQLTVTDQDGLENPTEKIVNVQWVNVAPVASAFCPPEAVNEGADVDLVGSGSRDEDDGIATFFWTQLMGPPLVDLSSIGSAADITFVAPWLGYHQNGKLPFRLTVVDTGGLSSSAECMVTIRDVTPPTITGAIDLTAEATSGSGAVVEFAPTANDAVDGDVAVTCLPVSGSTFALGATEVDCIASDGAGNEAQTRFTVTVQDTTPPRIADHADVTVSAGSAAGAVVNYGYPATEDVVDGSGTASCTPTEGPFSPGITTVTCTATDKAGNSATVQSFNVWVQYVWNGFFRPIQNIPTVNAVKAGSAVPVKFSLGVSPSLSAAALTIPQFLNLGLDVFSPGYPKTVTVSTNEIGIQTIGDAETVAAGSSSLSYDQTARQYVYVWKTEKAWAGASRQLQIKLKDGTLHTANFQFGK